MSREEGVKKVAELMKDAKVCTLATLNNEGQIVSRPMSLQQVEFDGDLWFITQRDSDKTRELQERSAVNVTFSQDQTWVSLSGAAELVDDAKKADELWNPLMKSWFPNGQSDPNLILIKVHAESAEYWDSDRKVTSLFKMASSAITGKDTDLGEHKTVEM